MAEQHCISVGVIWFGKDPCNFLACIIILFFPTLIAFCLSKSMAINIVFNFYTHTLILLEILLHYYTHNYYTFVL